MLEDIKCMDLSDSFSLRFWHASGFQFFDEFEGVKCYSGHG